MKQRTIFMAIALLTGCAALAAPGAHGPGGEHLEAAGAPAGGGLSRQADGSVHIPKLAQRRMGIRTLLAPETEAAASVQLAARITVDPQASGLVQSAQGGRIETGPHGLPVAGQAVRKGEVLAWVRYLADPFALASQQAQAAELRASRELADRRWQRLRSLEGSVPRKDIEAARIEAEALKHKQAAVEASLGAREALRSPVHGVIARSELQAGQVVDARQVLVEVVDPRRLMVEAVTPDVGLAAQLQQADLLGVSGVSLALVGAARALRDGVLPLNFRVQSAEGATPLAVGQPVTLIARLQQRRKGIVLPADAVVRGPANETVVWIKSGAQRYLPQPVQVQPLDSHSVLVTQGLAADNRVVVQGAALIAQIR